MRTLTFSEVNKGWTSFWGFEPDGIAGMDNKLFSVKNGNLVLHHRSETTASGFPKYNNIYGQQLISVLNFFINDQPDRDKIFKTLVLDGNRAWRADLKTNFTESAIEISEFSRRESRWFAYIRRNEDLEALEGQVGQGIGNLISYNPTGFTLTFAKVNKAIDAGDMVYKVSNEVVTPLGQVQGFGFQDGNEQILLATAPSSPPVAGDYCFAQKPARFEGDSMRGRFLDVTLENNDAVKVELFSVTTNAVLSYI